MAARFPRCGRPFPWTALLVVLGLGLRLYHYLRDPSVWHDEAALIVNVLDKSFVELLGPLTFHEAAPPLFLWIEKGAVLLWGDSTYALRLPSFLASCATLVLFALLARRVLAPAAVPWAVLLMACSDRLLWHACEAKPYAAEVFAATLVLALFHFTAAWPLCWRMALYALLAPWLIFLAYPGCFLYGGLLIALLPHLWRQWRWENVLAYFLLAVAVFGAFALLIVGPAHAQRCPEMVQCWETSFPPWERPWSVPAWTLLSTLEVFRYCCDPTGQILTVAAGIGAWGWWRRGQRDGLALLSVPFGLPLLASFVRAYPYGGARVLAYVSPALVLLIAEGIDLIFARLASPTPRALALVRLGVLLLLLAPLGRAVQRVLVPWPRADCAAAAAYVLANRHPQEAVAGNHWEYVYYFRRLGPSFILLDGTSRVLPQRLWLVATSGDPVDRQRLAQELPPGDWHTLEQQEFVRTSVFHLTRPGPGARSYLSSTR
jgi:hypothetical protein